MSAPTVPLPSHPWRRVAARAALAALLWAPLGVSRAAAQQVPPDQEVPPDEVPTEPTGGEEPAARHHETLLVQESLPYVPTSSTVLSKLPLARRDSPASVGVVSQLLLEERGSVVLGDALATVPGVNVQTGFGTFDFFVVRGIDSVTGGLLLVDGAPEPESSFYQLYNVEQVEVLKGPAAFVYGGSPLAAAVNLVRKQPRPGRFATVEAGAGSFATRQLRLDANAASEDGRLAFRLNGLGWESDGYRDGRDGRTVAANPALTWEASADTRVHVSLEGIDLERATDSGLPLLPGGLLPPVPRRRSYQSPFDLSDQSVGRFQVDVETRRGERLLLRQKLYARRLDWRSRGTLLPAVFPGPDGRLQVLRNLLLLDDLQETVGAQSEAVLVLGGPRARHHLVAGLEVARFGDEFTFDVAFLPPLDLLDPVETASEPLFLLPGQSLAADARSVVVAPYVVDQVEIGERWRLLLGARLDRLDFEDAVSGASRQDSQLSPMLGVVWAPTPALSLYGHAAEAFAPPSTFTRDHDRVPEESRQVEAGARRSWAGGKLEGSLAVYRLERENVAIPDDNGVTRQVGSQVSRGAELELTAEPSARLKVLVSYAHTDAELTEFRELVPLGLDPSSFVVLDRSGNTPAFTPENLLQVWASRHWEGGLWAGLGGRWVDGQFIAEDNAFEIDGYAVFDAAVGYSSGRWGVQLNLDNLSGERYLTRGSGATSVIPAPGLEAHARLRYTF